jgi:hypothetical protein
MSHGGILSNCISMLQPFQAYCDRFSGESNLTAHPNEPPPGAFRTAFTFAIRTMTAMDQMLSQPESAILALTLCRPFYELATGLLWASREPHGWRRLLMQYAKQDEKAAREAVRCPAMTGVADIVNRTRPHIETVLAWTDPTGKPLNAAPNVLDMLKRIIALDKEDNLVQWPDQYATLDYAAFYRQMCRPAHGNLVFIGAETPDFSMQLAMTGAVLSTHRLLQAFCHVAVCEAEQKAAIKVFEQNTKDLVCRCQSLTFASATPASAEKTT